MEPKLVNVVQEVDNTFLLIFGISAALLIGITIAMIWFVVRYSRKRNPNPATFHGNFWAEVVWIVVPTLLVLGMFYSGWHSYRALRDAPEGAIPVKVLARMWSWSFEYENGKKSPVLVVPVGKAVRLDLTSSDVLHGFYAPAFRLKIDTVPGMTTHGWFRADKPGEYVIFCSVYCGLQHTKMLSSITAVSQEEYDAFLAEKSALAPGAASPGKILLDAKGCLGCHSLDGSPGVGPSLKGVWGGKATLVTPGKKEINVTYDAKTLTMMIMGPRQGVVKGFEPSMPAYAGQISAEELQQILDFLEHGDKPDESASASSPAAGRALADAQGCLGCHSSDGSELAGPSFKDMYGAKSTAKDKAVVNRAFLDAVLRDPSGRLGRSSSMPPFPALTEEERAALAAYLESLSAHAAHADMPGMDHGAHK